MFWKRGTSGQRISNLSVQSRVRWGCRGAEILHSLCERHLRHVSAPSLPKGAGQPTAGDEPSPGSKEPEAQAVDPSQREPKLSCHKRWGPKWCQATEKDAASSHPHSSHPRALVSPVSKKLMGLSWFPV